MASDPIWKLTFFPNGKQRYLLTAEEAKSFYHIKNTSKTYEFFTISIDAPILPIRKIEPRQCGGLAKVTEQARDGGRSGIQVHPSASSTMHCDDTTHYINFLLRYSICLFVYKTTTLFFNHQSSKASAFIAVNVYTYLYLNISN